MDYTVIICTEKTGAESWAEVGTLQAARREARLVRREATAGRMCFRDEGDSLRSIYITNADGSIVWEE